jgi:hypothetical protein
MILFLGTVDEIPIVEKIKIVAASEKRSAARQFNRLLEMKWIQFRTAQIDIQLTSWRREEER